MKMRILSPCTYVCISIGSIGQERERRSEGMNAWGKIKNKKCMDFI